MPRKPTREQMITFIYKKVARKNLEYGCVVISGDAYHIILKEKPFDKGKYYAVEITAFWKLRECVLSKDFPMDWIDVVVWHDVMLGDTLAWFEKHAPIGLGTYYDWPVWSDVLVDLCVPTILHNYERKQKRDPIDDQSDECIEYIYYAIKKYSTKKVR